jgi:hypothetical protein
MVEYMACMSTGCLMVVDTVIKSHLVTIENLNGGQDMKTIKDTYNK